MTTKEKLQQVLGRIKMLEADYQISPAEAERLRKEALQRYIYQ